MTVALQGRRTRDADGDGDPGRRALRRADVPAGPAEVNFRLPGFATNHSTVDVASAASTGVIATSELETRSIQRPGDLLERVPGLLVSQHSGEGKANQYYVRGFNIDHGTDLALRVAGTPVNLPPMRTARAMPTCPSSFPS